MPNAGDADAKWSLILSPQVRSWLVPSSTALVLILLSFLPAHVKAELHTQGRFHHAVHLFVFAVATLICLGQPGSGRKTGFVLLGACALGVSIEVGQHFIYTAETLETSDILFDSFGILLAGMIATIFRKRFAERIAGWKADDS